VNLTLKKISTNHKAVSTTIATILLIVGLVVGAVAGYAIVSSTSSSGKTTTSTITVGGTTVTVGGTTVSVTTTSTVSATPGMVTYTIGSIQPLTGSYASFGVSFQNSVDLAVSQMNANLSAVGSNIRFDVVHADDGLTPQGAATAIQSEFQSKGVQVVIGPLTSAEVQGTVQFATQNHIVVLPGAATATSLIGISPYLFRLGQPGDQFEGQVIAQTIVQTGQKNVVMLYRDDTSEAGTYNFSSSLMTQAGLHVQGIALPPGASDYAAQVASAGTAVQQYLSSGGTTKNTAVALLDGGTEAQNVLQHASTTPSLTGVRWYGIESLDDSSLLGSSVGSFMAQANLTIGSPQVLSSPQFNYFNRTYDAKYGMPPEPYSSYFYDNTWIAMLSVLAAGSYNGAQIIQVLPLVAEHYYGASSTGIWLSHNDQQIAYYDVLECIMSGGTATFTKIGSYNGGTNQVTLG